MNDERIRRAQEALATLSADPEARRIAEHREMGRLLYEADKATARRQGWEEGYTKSFEEAFDIGFSATHPEAPAEARAKARAAALKEAKARAIAGYEAKDRAVAKVESILSLLRARGVEAPTTVLERVRACSDLKLLERWLDKAVVAQRAEELFD